MKKQHQILLGKRQISDLLFEIGYINKQGEIESLRRTICGGELESLIHGLKYRSKKMFIYDATDNNVKNCDESMFFSQNSIHSNGTNSFFFPNMGQNQYGRCTNIHLPLNMNANDMNDLSQNTENYFSL